MQRLVISTEIYQKTILEICIQGRGSRERMKKYIQHGKDEMQKMIFILLPSLHID